VLIGSSDIRCSYSLASVHPSLLQDVSCQTEPSTDTPSTPVAVSELSKRVFGGYFLGDESVTAVDEKVGSSSDLYGMPVPCAASGGVCTASSSECPAG
jgi:hypothetical protein